MDVLKQIYQLVDGNLPVFSRRSAAGDRLWDTLTPEQRALFEQYQCDQGRLEDEERQILFYAALRLGNAMLSGDSRRS